MSDEIFQGGSLDHAASGHQSEALREELRAAGSDPLKLATVDAKYRAFYGDKKVDLDPGIKIGEEPREKERNDKESVVTYQADHKEALSVQRKEWEAAGESYDDNMTLIKSFAAEHFGNPNNARELENMMSAFLAEGGNPARANSILLKMARQAQKGVAK